MDELIILGAGGTSREIAGMVEDLNAVAPTWRLLGFLDDNSALQDQAVDGYPVLGPISSLNHYTARLIIGMASSQDRWRRKHIVERVGLPIERYATLLHPTASISRHATIGAGTAILHNVVVTSKTTIGDHVLILQNAALAHDDIIENYVTIAPGSTIAGSVRLGAGSYVGAGSTIRNGITIEAGALVGLGAVVMEDVPADVTVVGNPARRIPNLKRPG